MDVLRPATMRDDGVVDRPYSATPRSNGCHHVLSSTVVMARTRVAAVLPGMSVSVAELVRRLYLDVLRVDSPGRRLAGRPGSDGRGRLYWHSWDGSSSCAVLPDRGSQRSRGSISSREWLACLSIRTLCVRASPQFLSP